MRRAMPVFAFLLLVTVQSLCGLPFGGSPTPRPPGPATELPETVPPPDEVDSVGTIDLVFTQVETGPPEKLQFLEGMQNFYNGDGVRVSGGGKGRLDLNDGTQMILFNETEISGVTVTAAPYEAELFLQRHGFLGNVPPGGNVVVHTPNGATITILGTDFFVVFDEQRQLTTAGNFDGTVLYTPPGGTEQPLEPGTLVDISANGNTTVEEMPFTPLDFERSADSRGTPLSGLVVLRRQGAAARPDPITPIVTDPPVVDNPDRPTLEGWVDFREDLGGVIVGAPAVASWGPNRLDVFARGLNDGLWHIAWDGSGWSTWEDLGGVITSSPAAVARRENFIDVFAYGLDRNPWRLTWDFGRWTEWSRQYWPNNPDGQPVVQFDPAVASRETGFLDVFMIDDKNSLWHQTLGEFWGAWSVVGPAFSSASAVGRDRSRMDVVTRGPNNQVYYYVYNDGWFGPEDLGQYTEAAPAITSWGSDRLDILVRGGDNTLEHKFWDGSRWSDWYYVGDPIYSTPAAVSWGPNRIDVFAQGEDGQLVHYYFAR